MNGTLSAKGAGAALSIKPGQSLQYSLTVADEESFIGTVVLQRSKNGNTWTVVKSWTGTAETPLEGAVDLGVVTQEGNAQAWYRLYVTAIDVSSDAIVWDIHELTYAVEQHVAPDGAVAYKVLDDGTLEVKKMTLAAGGLLRILGSVVGHLFGTDYFVNKWTGSDTTGDGKSPQTPFATITKALTAMSAGDRLYIAAGAYDESITIPATLQAISLIGIGSRGAVAIAPSDEGAEGLLVHASNVTLVNIDVAGESAADYACKVTGSGFRGLGCKFEGAETSGYCFGFGPGTAAAAAAGTQGHGGDCRLEDCELAWGYNGLALIASDYGAATQVVVVNGRFHNLSNIHVAGVPGAFGLGSVRNLQVEQCTFDRAEDGTAPSDFVKVDDALDTGLFAHNRFALATNASADLKIGDKVLWMANETEAGVSTARPA